MMCRLALAGVVAVLAALAAFPAVASATSIPGPNGKIVFTSGRANSDVPNSPIGRRRGQDLGRRLPVRHAGPGDDAAGGGNRQASPAELVARPHAHRLRGRSLVRQRSTRSGSSTSGPANRLNSSTAAAGRTGPPGHPTELRSRMAPKATSGSRTSTTPIRRQGNAAHRNRRGHRGTAGLEPGRRNPLLQPRRRRQPRHLLEEPGRPWRGAEIPIVQSAFDDWQPAVSPDGKRLCYLRGPRATTPTSGR